ncbi:cytochrome C oxidase subunit IV family protein [Aromatoleum buckelii]|uniref:Uncharacterized protein n=1 Tax=Aromatoleum buckelii TaxID=200254 RepID=A0ABX1MZN0_9RHOO|nr:cytochrome C oxidase subunit IV family protein [Aromatoleum buckelii]MCK0512944.1 cytochrome C oxidase subunit IV family protein [Aromatoleum buckelii]
MIETRKLDLAWITLVLLSIGSAGVGGTADPDLGVTAIIALVMGVKVRIVCTYFMELDTASRRIRRSMYAFCYGMPTVVVLTSVFGDVIARLTAVLM